MRYARALAFLLLALPLAGCIDASDLQPQNVDAGDAAGDAAGWAKEIPAAITGLDALAQATDVTTGSGIWLDGDYAFVSARADGLFIVDVSTPEAPLVVAQVKDLAAEGDDELYARDADVKWLDGRRIVALAGANQGIHVLDATDAANPVMLKTIELERGSHNVALHPTLPVLYNSNSWGQGNPNEVFDITDPAEPVFVGEFGEYGCHDITFFVSAEKSRLYCPGIQLTEIWDIADPHAPQLVVQIENEAARSYGAGLHHSAMSKDGKLLLIGDEFMGGGGPGCVANTPAGSTDLGALWFYDVSDEKNPKHLSHISPTVPAEAVVADLAENPPGVPSNPVALPFMALNRANCTTHFGDFVPGHEMVVMSWYRAGVLLVDFSNPEEPVFVDQWNAGGTNMWDARVHNGYVFTGDIARGLDVLTFV